MKCEENTFNSYYFVFVSTYEDKYVRIKAPNGIITDLVFQCIYPEEVVSKTYYTDSSAYANASGITSKECVATIDSWDFGSIATAISAKFQKFGKDFTFVDNDNINPADPYLPHIGYDFKHNRVEVSLKRFDTDECVDYKEFFLDNRNDVERFINKDILKQCSFEMVRLNRLEEDRLSELEEMNKNEDDLIWE